MESSDPTTEVMGAASAAVSAAAAATGREPPLLSTLRPRRLAALVAAATALVVALGGGAVATAAGAFTVTPSSGTPQNTSIGSAFEQRLVVTVSGLATGTGCPASVTFSAPSSGASAVFSTPRTGTDTVGPVSRTADATGDCIYRSSTLSANDTVGSYTVSASLAGGSAPVAFSLTNDGIMASAGTRQTAQDGSGFVTPFQVTVYTDGAPAKGVGVDFVAPNAGPSGVFATTNTDTATATTNAMGVATAPTFTANDTQGTYTVTATTTAISGTASFTLTNSAAGLPSSIAASAGVKQSAIIGATYAQALQVKVTDANGNPVQGVEVTFAAGSSSSGASGSFVGSGPSAMAVTGSDGVAVSPELQANEVVGTFTVTATTAGLGTAAEFTLTNLGPTSIVASTGARQSAVIGATYARALGVKVTYNGNPVQGVEVTFAAGSATTGASGSFVGAGPSAMAVTGSDGVAVSPHLQANGMAGTFTVTATTAGLDTAAEFTLTNLGPTSIVASKGAGQSAVIGATYARALRVKVTYEGKPVQGVEVTFAAGSASSGASGSFVGSGPNAMAVTGSDGVAVSPRLEANGMAGTFTVTATTAGLGTAADFTLTNLGPTSIVASKGARQSAVIGATYARALRVKVTYRGKPVQGVEVSFAAGSASSGASGTFVGAGPSATAVTGSDGVAVSPRLEANESPGTFTVTATTAGLGTAAKFTLTNLGPTSIVASKGARQSAVIGAAYARGLRVKVTHKGRPVQGVEVTFAAGSATTGASGSFVGSGPSAMAVTGSDGVAVSPRLEANEMAGTFTVTATTAGLGTAAKFTLTNLGGAPATVTPGAGVTQKTAVGHAFGIPLSVTVSDAEKNPLAGVKVTFAAPARGASGTFATTHTRTVTVKTNASGIAVAPDLRANDVSGGYIVTASVRGVSPPVAFALVNEA